MIKQPRYCYNYTMRGKYNRGIMKYGKKSCRCQNIELYAKQNELTKFQMLIDKFDMLQAL